MMACEAGIWSPSSTTCRIQGLQRLQFQRSAAAQTPCVLVKRSTAHLARCDLFLLQVLLLRMEYGQVKVCEALVEVRNPAIAGWTWQLCRQLCRYRALKQQEAVLCVLGQ